MHPCPVLTRDNDITALYTVEEDIIYLLDVPSGVREPNVQKQYLISKLLSCLLILQ